MRLAHFRWGIISKLPGETQYAEENLILTICRCQSSNFSKANYSNYEERQDIFPNTNNRTGKIENCPCEVKIKLLSESS